jgi:hypothetical protein
MKQILTLVGFITLIGLGCSDSAKTVVEPTKPDPTLTDLKATPETSWYSGQANITWSATNASLFKVTGPTGETVTVTGTTYTANNVLPNQNYMITAVGSSTSVTKTIAVQAYSEKKTNYCKEKYWINIYSRTYQVDNPSNYIDPPLITGKHYYTANGGGQVVVPSGPGAGTYPVQPWSFIDNETKINKGPSNIWTIDTLTALRHVEWKENVASDGKTWRHVLIWESH